MGNNPPLRETYLVSRHELLKEKKTYARKAYRIVSMPQTTSSPPSGVLKSSSPKWMKTLINDHFSPSDLAVTALM